MKLIFISIILVVTLLLSLGSIFPSYAADSVETTYTGDDLAYFLRLYDVKVQGVRYGYSRVLDPEEYQLVLHKGVNDVYLVVNVFNSESIAEFTYFVLNFYLPLDVHINSWQGDVYFRNTDKMTNTSFFGSLSFSNADSYELYDFEAGSAFQWPYERTITGPSGNKLINEDNPFYDKYYSQISYELPFSYLSSSFNHLEGFGIGFTLEVTETAQYMYFFAFESISIVSSVSDAVKIEGAIRDLNNYLEKEDPADQEANKELENDFNNASDKVDQAFDKINNSVAKPSFNFSTPDGDLTSGFNALSLGFAPIYNNEHIYFVLGIASVILVMSYLLFGKKG